MKTMFSKSLLSGFIAILVASHGFGSHSGQAAPDFTLMTNDGKSLTLSKLKGKRGALLVFFATWCPSCMAEVPQVKKFVEATRKKGVLVYGVNFKQSKRIVDKFVADKKVNYRILLDSDGAVSTAYNVSGIPLVIGIDAEGTVRYREHHVPRNPTEFAAMLTRSIPKGDAKPDKVEDKVSIVDRKTLQQWRESEKNLVVVDVLSPESYHRVHIDGAINIPLRQLDSLKHKLPKDARIVTYCASFKCHASAHAAKRLKALGYKDVHEYAGGIADWLNGDLPVQRGKKLRFVRKEALQKWLKEGEELVIIDVLSPERFKQAHIKGAINIPLAELESGVAKLNRNTKVVTYCANYPCHASTMAAEKLIALGFKDVYDYKGGIHEWKESGLPLGDGAGHGE